MGSSPHTPKYNQSADMLEQNRLNQSAGIQQYSNVNSPLGGYSVQIDPTTGQLTINKTLSDQSLSALNAQQSVLNNYSSDPTEAANAYYNAQMAYLQPQLDKQIVRAESSLTNRGLPIGSNAWNDYMDNIYDAQNRTLSALSNEALANGQQYQNNLLSQAAMLGSQVVDPTMVAGQEGAGLSNAYDKQFQNEQQIYQSKMAKENAKWNMYAGLANLGGGILGALSSRSSSNGDNGSID